jgi:hypothetical protein
MKKQNGSVSYALTEKQVEQLATAHCKAEGELNGSNTTYLRVLVTAMQAQLGDRKRGHALGLEQQVAVLETVGTKYYAAVLRGVSVDLADTDTKERNRRATFARSAKSTLGAFLNANGDVRELDTQTVTKAALRAQVHAGLDEAQLEQRQLQRNLGGLLRLYRQRAREHPDEAHAMLEGAIAMLQAALDAPDADEPEHDATGTMADTSTLVRGFKGTSSRVMPAPSQLHRGA